VHGAAIDADRHAVVDRRPTSRACSHPHACNARVSQYQVGSAAPQSTHSALAADAARTYITRSHDRHTSHITHSTINITHSPLTTQNWGRSSDLQTRRARRRLRARRDRHARSFDSDLICALMMGLRDHARSTRTLSDSVLHDSHPRHQVSARLGLQHERLGARHDLERRRVGIVAVASSTRRAEQLRACVSVRRFKPLTLTSGSSPNGSPKSSHDLNH
jgi:hypothetical protein